MSAVLTREEIALRILQIPDPAERTLAAQAALQLWGRPPQANVAKHARFADDPVGYARDVLGVTWWEKQVEVAHSVVNNQKTFVKASHTVGKTHLAGGLVNWHYDCFNPSITKTTAPKRQQVIDLTWKEVRLQRKGRNMMPKAPRIESYLSNGDFDPGHFAAGYTARDADSFQGDHEEHLMIIFEEATGIVLPFWEAAEGMLSSGKYNRWLAILNPTDTSSAAYDQEMSGEWNVISISALDHPNVRAELYGLPRPFPKAISLSWIEARLRSNWVTKIEASDAKPGRGDFCWPPLEFCTEKGIEPQWYRPGPLFEGRVLGRWPSQSVDSVWSEAMWLEAVKEKRNVQLDALKCKPEIGCDVARKGDDMTAIHVRRGGVSLHHESHNGWMTDETAGRLKQLADAYGAQAGISGTEVPVKVDDTGVGGGVTDQRGEYMFIAVNSNSTAYEEEKYPNRRSELWFTTAERADASRLDLSKLPKDELDTLRRQLMSPKWKVDSHGRRVVEPKDDTKKRLKRSPDDADGFNLAYSMGDEMPMGRFAGFERKSPWQ